MYAPFFGLSKEPFSIAPDPRFLFMSEQHREALAHLLYGLGGGGGFVLLTGEIGAGKTTVCRCFLEQVPERCTVAYVFNPKLTATELLQTVCGEFGITAPADPGSVKAHVDALNAFLLAAHAQGRQAILVIDEAQALSADVLEQLRLLTNLETAERKLLQIVLIGQPELRDMLARPGLEQLAQRVIARYHLGALSPAETRQYIRHRLAVAGPNAPLPFDGAALARIHRLSGGVPRRINLLADRALLGAYAQARALVDRRTVDQAAREVFGASGAPAWRRPAVVSAVLLLLLAGGAGLWLLERQRAASSTKPQRAVAASSPAVTLGAAVAAAGAASAPGAAAATAPATPASQAPAAAPPEPPSTDPAELLAAAHALQATAWRELALRWNVAIGEGEPCTAVAQAQLACFRSAAGGLPVVRQLARPGVITLQGVGGAPVYAVLAALDEDQATVQVGAQRFVLTLPALASAWRGEFATYWRVPPGWRDGTPAMAVAATRDWVEQQLGRAGFDPAKPLRQRVFAFQLAQGLPPDGQAGPMTLMRLNRAAGVDEPPLQAER
ncbi:MAG: AAA family ATPase [Rubrivivax sp.]|nr:AAA family ATPase [Rubrivivax sp.]